MSYTDDERIRAKRRALYILAQRDHSKKELYDKLIKNYPPDLCEMVVGPHKRGKVYGKAIQGIYKQGLG